MADYWVKVYIDILDDPKMATMPDRLWRRTIELFMLAKKFNKQGHLPDTKQLAWLLRMTTDDLDMDLRQIALTKIVQPEPSGWFVVNFEKRQSAASSTERSSQFRKRTHHKQYEDDNATYLQRNVPQRAEAETETEAEAEGMPPQIPNIFSLYEQEIGVITPFIRDQLLDAEQDYPAEWIPKAFKEACNHNARNWKYTETILRRWKKDGISISDGNKRIPIGPDGRPLND